MADILYKDESYKIIGACIEGAFRTGRRISRVVYQEALEKQFMKDAIPFEREKYLKIQFDGEQLKKTFKADFVCYDKIIVELKAASFIHSDNIDQTKNYLKSTKFQLGFNCQLWTKKSCV